MRTGVSRIFAFAVSAMLLLCCSQRSSETMSALRHADDIIEDLPDSAYNLLKDIDAASLAKGKEQAYYSLLMSMAIDKQYIDLTADSVIAPAAKYYRHHGSNDDKMRTAYYHARILENAGDEEGAMKLLVDNLKLARKSQYHLFKGRYYIKIAALYNNNYDFEHAYDYAKEAKNEYRLSERVKNYVTGLLTTSTYLQQLKEFRAAEAELDTVKMYWERANDHQKGEYYRQRINIERLFKGNSGALYRDECLSEHLAPNEIPYTSISFSFLDEQNLKEAESALAMCSQYNPELVNTPVFQYQLANVHRAKGNYENALKAEQAYSALNANKNLHIINSDTRFIEERHDLDVVINRDNFVILLLVTLATFLCLGIYYTIRHFKARRKHIEALYNQLAQEKTELENIISQKSLFDEDNVKVINERLGIINDLLLAKTTGNVSQFKASEKKIAAIAQDKGEVMLTTASLFSCSHPEFILYLKNHGLTSKECGYCCLFILGFSGKEINTTLFNGSGYNYSSNIRKKLGLNPRESNLGIYLKGIIADLDKN